MKKESFDKNSPTAPKSKRNGLLRKSMLFLFLLGFLPLLLFGVFAIIYTNNMLVSFKSIDEIYSKTSVLIIVFGVFLAAVLALILVSGIEVSRRLVMPIKRVTDAFRALQSGDLEHVEMLHVESNDEIAEMGDLFNSIIDAHEDITLQKKLERKLNEQNNELQKALEKLKQTQTQMLQQEKLAGIGQLAAGVAHEINNPLGYVSGNADMLRMLISRYDSVLDEIADIKNDGAFAADENAREYFNRIDDAWKKNKIDLVRENVPGMMNDITEGLARIAAIVNGLRSFSRNNQLEEKSAYDLNDGIKTTLLVANNEIKYVCDVNFTEGKIPSLYANGGQINQVLLNMIINASHAIKEKFGKGRGLLQISTYYDGGNVHCRIEDNGCGMTEEVRNKIFEPFFTTKPVGQGTGLGLGIAYDIIYNKHGGNIDVQSTPGEGTVFTISIPVSEAPSEDEFEKDIVR